MQDEGDADWTFCQECGADLLKGHGLSLRSGGGWGGIPYCKIIAFGNALDKNLATYCTDDGFELGYNYLKILAFDWVESNRVNIQKMSKRGAFRSGQWACDYDGNLLEAIIDLAIGMQNEKEQQHSSDSQ